MTTPDEQIARRPARVRLFLLGIALLCLVALALQVASQLSAFHVQDDAYMFARYAGNLLEHGRASWNPDGDPTYGTTSVMYLAVVAPLCALWPGQPALAVGLASLITGAAALLLIARLCTRGVGASREERPWLLVFLALVLAGASEDLAAHMTNGMDTMLDIAALAGLFLLWTNHQREPSRLRALGVAVWGGLCYSARPDLALFTVCIPLGVFALSRGEARRGALRILVASIAVIGAQVAAAKCYYGTPFPLGFYVKSLNEEYGEAFTRFYANVPLPQLGNFVRSYWAFLLVIGVDLLFHWRRFVSGGGGLRLGVAVATLSYVLYYLLGVVQVVAFHQRFYYPTLPALCFLAAWSALDLLRDLRAAMERSAWRFSAPSMAPVIAPLLVIGGLWLLRIALPPFVDGVQSVHQEWRGDRMAHFDMLERYRRQSADFWLALDSFSALPDDLVIATTEVGQPAVMNPRKQIIDLVGLNEESFAQYGFSADRLFDVYRPDVIYMPHPHYTNMNRDLRAHPGFQGYEEYTAEALGAGMGLALRRDSKYFAELHRMAEEARARLLADGHL
jgi:hypothetical protein